MLTLADHITAAIGDGPDAPVAVASDFGASLIYASAEAHAARVSADVEALRSLPGLALVESLTPAESPLVVHLRYAPAPAVEAPRPIAPVPATPPRRR